MFSVKNNDCVGFESKWKVKRVFSESTSQTTEYSQRESSTNTSLATDVEIQTQDEPKDKDAQELDMQRLANWLKKIFPDVQRQLTEAVNSKAFSGCYPLEESVDAEAKITQTLNAAGDGDGDTALRVSALSWNSTGNTLAVSCSFFHKTWCHHSGQINFYTFDRYDKLPDIPNKKLSTSACVSSLCFHETLPYVIASGTCAGEVIIWNIQHDEGDNVVAKATDHEEGITAMGWVHDVDNLKLPLLATSSLDGTLNLWSFSLASSLLTVKKKYKIKSPVLAKVQRPSAVPETISKKVVRGILSFDFSAYVPDMFVAGVEGGLIVQCSMLGTTTLKGSTDQIAIEDPVFKYYEPHDGEVNTVCFSPNRRDMFLSSASDAEIRIYVVGQETPARVFFLNSQINHVCWVPYQEKLIAACGESGYVEVFHLISGQRIPDITNEKVVQTTLLQIEVNKHRCTTVAVGNNRGEVQIWTIPWGYFILQKV